jgi:uncharacterized protein
MHRGSGWFTLELVFYVSLKYLRLFPGKMPTTEDRTCHCYRCVYTWRARKVPVRMCPRCKSRLWAVPEIRPKPPHPTGVGVPEVIAPHLEELRRQARRYGVESLRVFGSVARGEASSSSDVDLMFDSKEPLGLLRRLEFQQALEQTLGRRVDLVREEYLKWYLRPQAVADAVDL